MKPNDVVLTGVSRGGTTLTCHLLNRLPGTLALSEPMAQPLEALPGRDAMCDAVERFFAATRRAALVEGRVETTLVDGALPSDPFSPGAPGGAPRTSRLARGHLRIDKPLEPDFLLAIKHPAPFTALLEDLAKRFRCYAVIRNPLAVLASWDTLAGPLREGRVRAESLDPGLARSLESIDDRIGRQIALLGWFFGKYQRVLPAGAILRYEDLVASGGKALRAITPRAEALAEPLENRNTNQVYDRALLPKLAERLLRSDGAFWHFYSRESVERLLAAPA